MGLGAKILPNGLDNGPTSKLNALPMTTILWSRIWHFTNLDQYEARFFNKMVLFQWRKFKIIRKKKKQQLKNITEKLELASQPCHFFRVLLYESVQACAIDQSACSTKFWNNATKKSIALKILQVREIN